MSAVMKEVAAPVRRNGRGAYLVCPPGTSKPIGYSRATSISSLLDDTGFLKDWGQRMTALGLAGRPDLFRRSQEPRPERHNGDQLDLQGSARSKRSEPPQRPRDSHPYLF
jgi:hypothetical protein